MEWSVHNHFNCTLNFMFLLSSPSFILSEHPVRFPPVSEGVPPTPLPSAPDMIAGLWSSPAVGFPSPCALLWHSFVMIPCRVFSRVVRVTTEPTLRVRGMVTQAHYTGMKKTIGISRQNKEVPPHALMFKSNKPPPLMSATFIRNAPGPHF